METRICKECGKEKPISEFYHGNRKCKRCSYLTSRVYKEKSWRIPENKLKNRKHTTLDERIAGQRERCLKYHRKNKVRLYCEKNKFYAKCRRVVIEKYGEGCECCGESHFEFLAIDHRNGGGNQQRKAGYNTMQLIFDLYHIEGLLPEYRILCHNCNNAIGFYGRCPHANNQMEIKDAI